MDNIKTISAAARTLVVSSAPNSEKLPSNPESEVVLIKCSSAFRSVASSSKSADKSYISSLTALLRPTFSP